MKTINFIGIGLLLSSIVVASNFIGDKFAIPYSAIIVVVCLMATTIVVTRWQVASISESASRFVTSFSGGMGIKLFVTILLLVSLLLLSEKGKAQIGVMTIVTYLAFLVENIRQLFKLLKSKK